LTLTTTAIVADSSYIIEGLLKDKSLLEGYNIFAPDYGLYEVLNTVWKHEVLLKKVADSSTILTIFFDLVSSGRIRFMALEEETIRSAYALAVKTRTPVYDAVFVALAKQLDIALKTFDMKQAEIFKA
jgi:predicted nucleic acid-binding protein